LACSLALLQYDAKTLIIALEGCMLRSIISKLVITST
jgi:hypothetical protein